MNNEQLFNKYSILKPYIKNVVVLQSDTLISSYQSFRFFADGLPGIIFGQSNHAVFLNRNEKQLPHLFLYGQTVKPIEITASENYKMIILYLYPHVIKSLFGIEASELTDTCVDLDLLPVKGIKSLKEQLSEASSTENQRALLLNFLSEQIQGNEVSLERDLQYVTDNLISANGNLPLKVFQDELNVSQRTFERKFLRHVGIPPRLFARICRFNAVLSQIRSGNSFKLTDIAYDNGFADQSHLGRTFKEFTGLTPSEYLINYRMRSENF